MLNQLKVLLDVTWDHQIYNNLAAVKYTFSNFLISHKNPYFLCSQGANQLKVLLELALDHIPTTKYKSTPIALKATAGLRLLPMEKAQALLDAVSTGFLRILTIIVSQRKQIA